MKLSQCGSASAVYLWAYFFSDKTFVYLTPMTTPVEVGLGAKEAVLAVAVYAYPEPELVWYQGDVPIDPEDRHFDMRYECPVCFRFRPLFVQWYPRYSNGLFQNQPRTIQTKLTKVFFLYNAKTMHNWKIAKFFEGINWTNTDWH